MQRKKKNPSAQGEGLTGSVWFNQSAYRAVNQAVGRVTLIPLRPDRTRLDLLRQLCPPLLIEPQVIRHRFDYGAILLADTRFGSASKSLSYWLRRRCVVQDKFGPAVMGLVKFFKEVLIHEAERIAQEKMLAEGSLTTESDRVKSKFHGHDLLLL